MTIAQMEDSWEKSDSHGLPEQKGSCIQLGEQPVGKVALDLGPEEW